jgi:hypothetical protein
LHSAGRHVARPGRSNRGDKAVIGDDFVGNQEVQARLIQSVYVTSPAIRSAGSNAERIVREGLDKKDLLTAA